jgi:hypothetical protein
MARWDRNWQGAAHGRNGLPLQRDPQKGDPRQSGRAVLSGGKSAPLNRTAGRDPLTSRSAGCYLPTCGRVEASIGRLVDAPASDDASEYRGDAGGVPTAEAPARATPPQERAGRYPFSSGPLLRAPADLSQALYVRIVQEWAATLSGPFDWADWPLDHYVFSEAFHESLEHQRDLDDAAWACAMVACGLAHEFPEMDVQPRLRPDGAQFARDDGAEGYRCTIIITGRGAGSRVNFWRLSSGVIEFESFTAMRLVRSSC